MSKKLIEVSVVFGGKPVAIQVKDHGIPLGDVNHDKIFKSMQASFNTTKQRCYNPSCKDYKYYGGRGISICQEWRSNPFALIIDMGLRPDGYTLERKDNDGPYSPDNCVWATRATQGLNTRLSKLITYNGETLPVAEWERRLGFKAGTLKARLGPLGYTVEQAFNKEVKPGALLPDREYAHMKDQSWRTTEAMHAKPQKPHLTIEQVKTARLMYSEVAATFSTIATYMGVSVTTASNAVQGLAAYTGDEYAIAA